MVRKTLATLGIIATAMLAALLYAVAPASAAPDASAVSTVSGGALTLRDTLVEIATTVLPYAAAIVAIFLGWRVAKRFVRA